ncbi:unnamed protein product, partial [Polarella glacialis]
QKAAGLSTAQAASLYHDLAVLNSRLPKPDLERVALLYRQSLQLAPSRAVTQENCGITLAVAGRHGEAAGYLQAAKRLGRDTPELHSGLGAVRYAQRKLKKAAVSFGRALELRPGWTEAEENLRAVQSEIAEQKR